MEATIIRARQDAIKKTGQTPGSAQIKHPETIKYYKAHYKKARNSSFTWITMLLPPRFKFAHERFDDFSSHRQQPSNAPLDS